MALVARYRLNGDYLDSSGNQNHLSLMGNVGFETGKISKGARFVGSNANCLYRPLFSNIDKVFSISLWFKNFAWPTPSTDGLVTYNRFLISQGRDALDAGINIGFTEGYVSSYIGNSGNVLVAPINLGRWYHLVLESDGINFRYYLDGVKVLEIPYTTITWGQAQGVFVIGKMAHQYNITNAYFAANAVAEDVRIYDHVLSTKEIKELAKAKILHLSMDTYEEPTTNLIPDGNFSRKTYQLPYLNSVFNNATAAFTDGDSSTPCKGNVLELTSTGGDSYMSPYNGLGARLLVVAAGETYTYSFYSKAKSSPSCKPGIYLFFLDASGVYDVTSFRQNWTVGTEWVRNSFTFTVPAGKTGISIRIENQEVGTTAQYNGLQLEKKPYVTPFSDGARYKGNMHFEAYNIYNNFSIPSSLVATGEYYLGEKVFRLTMTPTTQAQVNSIKTTLWNQGILATSMTFLANTKYATSCLWKPISKPDTIVGGVASDITGFVEGPREKFKDGWNRYNRYRIGEATDKTNGIYISAMSPSFVLGDSLVIDFCGLRTEKDTIYCSKYYNGIIEDKSDFGNHVNITDMITAVPYTEDSKLGKQALAFDGKMRPIAFSKIVPGCLTNCTVAFWRKSSNTGYELILNERDSRLSESSEGHFMAKDATHFYSHKVTGNQNLYVDGVLMAKDNLSGLDDGNWHHVVMSGVNLSLFSKLMMNTYSAPGVSGANDWHMKSTIDDFRIYATELSQADVIELYKVRTSIDKLGNIFTGTIEPNEVEDGLIAYYPLNGDVLNRCSTSDGNINGATKVTGKGQDYCYEFDGVDDYGDIENVFAGRNTFSISAWVYPKHLECLILGDEKESPYEYGSVVFSTKFLLVNSIATNTTNRLMVTGFEESLIQNSWNHLVATFDYLNKRAQVYVNGVLIVNQSFAVTCLPYNSGRRSRIGIQYGVGSGFVSYGLKGMLQQLRIYDKVISKDVVTKLFTETYKKISISKKGSIKANKISTRGVMDRLIAHWPLNGNVLDKVGSYNSVASNATFSKGFGQPMCAYYNNNAETTLPIDTTKFMNGKKPFSISFYAYITDTDSYAPVIMIGDVYNGLTIHGVGADRLEGGNAGATFDFIRRSYPNPKNVWIKIDVVYDGNALLYYRDGVLIDTNVQTIAFPTTLQPVKLGRFWGGYYLGYLQDVRIYAKALTLGEIKLNYNLTKADRIPYSISKDGILYVKDTKEGL